jgi:hypothetical protein
MSIDANLDILAKRLEYKGYLKKKKKKRGRIPNSEKGLLTQREKFEQGLQSKPWEPSVWKPEYEAIVSRSIQGFSNAEIAAQFHYTPEHVSTILNCKEAKLIIAKAIEHQKSMMNNSKDKLTRIHEKMLDRVIQVADNDDMFKESPLAVISKLMEFHKEVVVSEKKIKANLDENGNPISSSRSGGNHQTNVFINTEHIEQMVKGLDKANEVRQLHTGGIVIEDLPGPNGEK